MTPEAPKPRSIHDRWVYLLLLKTLILGELALTTYVLEVVKHRANR